MEGECPPPPLLLYPPWAHSLPQGPEPSPSAEAGPVLSSHAASCPWTGLDSGSRHAVALPLLQAAPAQLEEQSPSRGTRSPCSLGSLCLTDCAAQTNGSPAQPCDVLRRLDGLGEGVLPGLGASVCLQGTQRGEGGLWLQGHKPRLGGRLVEDRVPGPWGLGPCEAARGPGAATTRRWASRQCRGVTGSGVRMLASRGPMSEARAGPPQALGSAHGRAWSEGPRNLQLRKPRNRTLCVCLCHVPGL